VAVNCWVWPAAIDAVAGVTAIDTSTAGVTVSAAVPEMAPDVAVIVAAPVATPVARPCEPDAFDTVAAPVDDDHVTVVVRFCVLRSEYVPVAVNCRVWPVATDAAEGLTAIDTSTAGVTVNAAVPEVAPDVAVMVAAPVATPVASPCEPDEFDTVAAAVLDDDHVTVVVRFWVLRSE
jgi:hypothetical protein